MKRDIISAAIGILVLTLFCGILYPLVITGISQVAFPGSANGQQVKVAGKLVGSQEIGQNFGTVVIGKNGKPEMQDGNPVTAPIRATSRRAPRRRFPQTITMPPRPRSSNLGPNSVATEQEISSNIQAYISLNGRYSPRRADRREGARRRRQYIGLGHRS